MAYVLPTVQEEEDKGNQTPGTGTVNNSGAASGGSSYSQPAPTPVVQTSSGVGGASGGRGGSAPASTGQSGATPTGGGTATTGTGQVSEANPSSSGLFTNLSAYLNANPTGGTSVEQTAAAPITNAVNTGTTALQNASTGFNNAVTSGTDSYNPSLVSSFVSNPSGASPTDVTNLENQVAGKYTGPTSFEGTSYGTTAQNAIQTASEQANLANTAGGQEQLLRESNANKPTQYTNGGLNLDQFLMAASPDASSALSNTAAGATKLASSLGTATTNNDAAVKAAQNTSTATGAQTTQDITNAENAMQTNLTNTATADQTAAQKQYTDLQAALQSANKWNPTTINKALSGPQQQLTAAQTAFNNLQTQIANAEKSGANTVMAPATGTNGQPLVGRNGQPILKSIPIAQAQTQLATLQTNLTNAQNNYNTIASKQAGNLTPAQLQQLGLTQQQYLNLIEQNYAAQQGGAKGVDLTSYLKAPDISTITPQSIATQTDVANWNALNAVVPGSNQQFLSGATGNPTVNAATFDNTTATSTLAAQIQSSQQAQKILSAEQSATKQAQQTQQTVTVVGGIIVGAQLGAEIGSIIPGIGNVIGAVVGGIIGGIVGLFCFEAGTPILMEDGTYKNVEDIEIGDRLMLGGMVTATGKALTNQLYQYKGTRVNGDHTVYEDGKWLRVMDSELSVPVDMTEYPDEVTIVYPLVTEKHLYATKEFICADLVEVEDPQWELSLEERMDLLNSSTERNTLISSAWEDIQALKYNKVG